MSDREPEPIKRAMPPGLLFGGRRREPPWIHGSLSAPLAGRMDRRRVRMVTRGIAGDKPSGTDGQTLEGD